MAAALASCGGASGDPGLKTDEAVAKFSKVVWRQGGPAVIPNHGPKPTELVIKDLRVGSGAVLKKGRTATLQYGSFDFRTGEQYDDWWGKPYGPLVAVVGQGELLGAREAELKGMRVGGRREILVPGKYLYGNVPVLYVLELVAVS